MITAEPELSLLVCEASRAQRSILAGWARASGFNLLEASDGATALEMIQDQPVDVVVTGIEMPDMTGLELGWHIKSLPAYQQAYVIVVTSTQDPRLHIEALDSGADDFLRKPFEEGELRARLRVAGRIARLHRELNKLAQTDALTGTANRRRFYETLAWALKSDTRSDPSVAVILFDIDHFKAVNDTHGHAAGDEVLRAAARAVQERLDARSLLGRLGGEEFGVLIPSMPEKDAVALAEQLRQAIGSIRVTAGKQTVKVTASFGVALANAGSDEAGDVLNAADRAMYRAKRNGRDQVVLMD